MEQITISILTLLALYVLYSECIKLPAIVKKNKKLCYVLVLGLYFYYHRTNVVEGVGKNYYNPGELNLYTRDGNINWKDILIGIFIIIVFLTLFL